MVSLLQIYMALNSYRQVLLQSCPQISVLMVEQTDACNAITMLYLSQHAITSASRTDPPGCAMYFTPLL